MKTLKPMLGVSIPRESLIEQFEIRRFLASYKLDGIRALVKDGVVLSRSLKPIPNRHVQELFGQSRFEGFDGELIVGSACAEDVFRTTTSGVMSEDKKPDVRLFAFDLWNRPNTPFHDRIATLQYLTDTEPYVVFVDQTLVETIDEVDELSKRALSKGYEGLILRNPLALYKFGRSTIGEGGLLKIKPFVDAEAEVVGRIELEHNNNEAFTNELGRTARSYAKAGKALGGVLGALICRTPEGVIFQIGTGFSQAEREALWIHPSLEGKIVKYKSLVVGVKDKPRHPVFLGFRDKRDM